MPDLDEHARRISEAREWLRRGYTTKAQVDALWERIAKHRGRRAADRLVQDMRDQWAIRAEWL
jgi:hypothetical protein